VIGEEEWRKVAETANGGAEGRESLQLRNMVAQAMEHQRQKLSADEL